MKLRILFLFTLLFAITLGCNKEYDIATNENDQDLNVTLKSSGTYYEGTTEPDFTIPPNIDDIQVLPNGNVKISGYCSNWIEDVSSDLLSGPSIYCENVVYNKWKPEIHFWGSVEITPDHPDVGGGVWQGHFNGDGTFLGDCPEDGFDFLGGDPVEVNGIIIRLTGHGGGIQGMVARAEYSINTSSGLIYHIEGEYK